MTVGISYTNGLEAIVVTDSMATMGARSQHDVIKAQEISSNKYHSVLFGAGSFEDLEAVKKTAEKTTEGNFASFSCII